MKVYAVLDHEFGGDTVIGVFSTWSGAKKYANWESGISEPLQEYSIEEYEVDGPLQVFDPVEQSEKEDE